MDDMAITIVFSGLNILFAIINVCLIFRQCKLQKDAFCFQLMERRMNVYTAFKNTLSSVIEDASVPNQVFIEYAQEKQDAELLFGPDVIKAMEEIFNLVKDVRIVHRELVECTCEADREQLCQKEVELLLDIDQKKSETLHVFGPYIYFGNYKTSSKKKVTK